MVVNKGIADFVEFIEDVTFDEHICVEYKYRPSGQGYSRLKKVNNKQVFAHRFSYCWFNCKSHEEIEGLCVMHKCDNPSCVNPLHLIEGTWHDNNRDRSKKGRTVVSSCRRKLTRGQVEEIKRRYNPKRDKINGVGALAKEFGVDTNLIYKAVRGGYDWEGVKTIASAEDDN